MNTVSIHEINRADNILRLMLEMMSFPSESLTEYPVKHYFAPGMYAREMFIPKGAMIVGKVHKHSHLNTIAYGDISVATFEGVERHIGHKTLTSPAGVQRAVYANEDTLWTTYHLTNETDLQKIEEEIIMPFPEYTEFLSSLTRTLGGAQ
jgi:hypothetical protein